MNSKSASIGFVFVVVLMDVIGFGVIIPVIPELISELTGVSTTQASTTGGWLLASYALAQFVFAPILGGLSDQYGRRPVLLIAMLGLALDYVVIIFAPTIAWFFIARLISGMCGSSITVANAYIADVSTAEDRAKNFGMVGAAFGLGFIIGPVLGMVGEFGLRLPFIVAAILAFANLAYGYFMIPESLTVENRRPFEWKRANPLGTFAKLYTYQAIFGLLICYFLITIASHSIQSNWAYYTQAIFGWEKWHVGASLAVVGLLFGLSNMFLIGAVTKRWGSVNTLFIGLAFTVLSFVLYAFAYQSWMLLALVAPYAIGGMSGSSLQAIMSKQVPKNSQGELQSGITSMAMIAAMIGPIVMTTIFEHFAEARSGVYFPGAPFLLAAILVGLSIVSVILSIRGKKDL